MTKQDYDTTYATSRAAVITWKDDPTDENEATMDETNEIFMAADVLYYAGKSASAGQSVSFVLQDLLMEANEGTDPRRSITVQRAISIHEAV